MANVITLSTKGIAQSENGFTRIARRVFIYEDMQDACMSKTLYTERGDEIKIITIDKWSRGSVNKTISYSRDNGETYITKDF